MKVERLAQRVAGRQVAVMVAERSLLKWLSSLRRDASRSTVTRLESWTISPSRAAHVDRGEVVRVARGRTSATCTITSYCLPSRLKRVTWRPPSSVSSVRPIVSTSTPSVGGLVAVDVAP